MTHTLHTKYRPQDFDELVAQESIVKSLEAQLQSDSCPHSFLFLGPPGCGKTTLARIMAKKVGCHEQGIIEIDAAVSGGVEEIRELTQTMNETVLVGGSRMVIIDEAHALSKQSWSALLKSHEEPAAHSYWALCTNEENKIPAANKTRLTTYRLNPVPNKRMVDYLDAIAEAEGIVGLTREILVAIADKAEGSVRQALVYLSQCQQAGSLEEALELIRSASTEEGSVIDLARLIASGSKDWASYKPLLEKISPAEYGSVRPILMKYLAKVVQGSTKQDFVYKVRLLDAVEQMPPFLTEAEGLAQLLLLVGRILLN